MYASKTPLLWSWRSLPPSILLGLSPSLSMYEHYTTLWWFPKTYAETRFPYASPQGGFLKASSLHEKVDCITSMVSLRLEGCYIEQTSPMWYLSWNHGTNRKKGNSKQARVESWTWIYLYDFYDTSHLITMIYRRGTNINCSTRYCRQFLIF